MTKTFGFPETCESPAAYLTSKTRRLPDGRFEAVASVFFMAKRGLTLYAVAPTRYRAERLAASSIETQSKLQSALKAGLVSYEQQAC